MCKALFLVVGLLLAGHCLSKNYATADYNVTYDPTRDPFEDFNRAQEDALQSGKLILISLGGNWCTYCHLMDRYIEKNEKIRSSLLETFVVLKVNVSEENYNQEFRSLLPEVIAYPDFIITNAHGVILGRQSTAVLEQKRSYSHEAFMAFIEKWRNVKENDENIGKYSANP